MKQIAPTESELKEIIVNYVGNSLTPTGDEITVEQVIEVFADQFPEFLLAIAEENWVNGYTQALKDLEYVEKREKDEPEEIHKKQES